MSTCQVVGKLFFGSTIIFVFAIRSVLTTPEEVKNEHLQFMIFTLLAASIIELILTYLLIIQLKNLNQDVFTIISHNQSFCLSCCNYLLLGCFSGVTAYAIMLFFKDADTFPSTEYFGSYTLGYLLFLTLPYVLLFFYLIQICSAVADYACGFQKHKETLGMAGAIGLPLFSLWVATTFHPIAWTEEYKTLSTLVSIASPLVILFLPLHMIMQNLLQIEGVAGLCRILLISLISCLINGCFPLLSLMCAIQFSSKFLEQNIFSDSMSYGSQVVVQVFLLFWSGLLIPPYLNSKTTKQIQNILPDSLFSLKWLTITYMFEQFLQLESLLVLSYLVMPGQIQKYSYATSLVIVMAALANILILILCMVLTLFFFGYKDCSESKTNCFSCCSWLLLFLVYIFFFIIQIVFISLSDAQDSLYTEATTHLVGIAISTHIAILGYSFAFNALRLMVHLQDMTNKFFSGFGNLSQAQVNELMIQLLNPNQRPELNINLEEVLEKVEEQKESQTETHHEAADQDELICSICLGYLNKEEPRQRINQDGEEEEREGREVVRIKKCKHLFHKDCISNWLHHHDFCPMDRKKVYLNQ